MMNDKENQNNQLPQEENSQPLLWDEDYQGRDVDHISAEKEKTKVSLDDIFLLLTAQEKRDKRIKIIALVVVVISAIGILVACIKLVQEPTEIEDQPVPTVEITPIITVLIQTAEPTEVPTKAPTAKPTKKPTPKPTKKPTPKPTREPTAAPTRVPATAAPTKAPKPTRDVFEEEGVFEEE